MTSGSLTAFLLYSVYVGRAPRSAQTCTLSPGLRPNLRPAELFCDGRQARVRAFSLWRADGAPAVSEWLKCEAGFNSGTISSVYAELMKVTLEPFACTTPRAAPHLGDPPSGARVRRRRFAPESHPPRAPPLPFSLSTG